MSISCISSIFKGIDELFKEATNEEVVKFLSESFISLKNDFAVKSVSKPNRKRIALAMESLNNMSHQERCDILTYIDGYCKDKLVFNSTNSQFEISKDDELKYLLYGIHQRFYTAPFGGQKRLANSVQVID